MSVLAPVQLPFTSKAAAPRRSRWRWLVRLLPVAMLLVLVVWFAPMIVAKTELRNRFARQALADVHGSVEVGGASLGWLSPVELRDVVVKDEAGRTVLTAPKITSQKPLFDLSRNKAAPGEFVIENPTLAVVCEKGTTNVEGAFAEYLKDSPNPGLTRTPVALKVTGGTLTITDAGTGKTTRVEGIDAAVNVPANRDEPVTANLTAATGDLRAEVSAGAGGSAKVSSAGLPLDTFAPLVTRADPGLSLAGALTTDLRVTWGKGAAYTVAGTASATQFALAAPGLNGDTLRFDSVQLPLDVELAGRVARVRKFDLTCDVGTLSAAGTLDPEDVSENWFAQHGVSVKANVELAKLASKLPKLLRLKEGTELTEGRLEVELTSTADAGGTVWAGKVNTSALKGTRAGKPVAWEQPLHVEFVGRYAKDRLPTFEKLVCTSDCIALNTRITPDTVQAAANVYLDKLGARLGDFVDLGGFYIDGEASAALVGRRDRAGTFSVSATVELKNFAFTDRRGKGLTEPALKLEMSATGTAPPDGAIRLATATAELTAGGDELRLTLLEPVPDVWKLAGGSADVHLAGDLARWKARVAALTKIPAFPLSGSIDARGRAKLGADRVTVNGLAVTLTRPKLDRWIRLDEPIMSAAGDLALARATGTATFTNLTINSAPLSVTGGTLAFEPQADKVIVSGSGPCVADLNRLGKTVRLYADANGPDALHGRGVGPVKFRTDGDTTTFDAALDVTDFGLGPKEKFVWFEPTLKLVADGAYSIAGDALTLAAAKVERPGLALDAKGKLDKIASTRDVNFGGTVRYDWAKLTPLVRDFVGASFTATGSGSRTFALAGQLQPGGAPAAVAVALPASNVGGPVTLKAPGAATPKPAPVPAGPSLFATFSGNAAVGWESITAYGFDIGKGELSAKMARGVATVSPITAEFGGGTVTLAPTLHLETTPGAVVLAKGTVIDHAKLTPAATAGALGYALPAIANSANAEGEISAVVGDNRIALGDITQSNLTGTLVIHKATVGLSPVAAQVANVLGMKDTTMTLVNESAVPIQVANGRVYHQNFPLRISGTTFHTSGSVGFDDTLDLVIDVPLPKDLPALKNNPVLMKAVAGKVLKVPMRGTLSRPELDPRAFNDAVLKLAREGAKEAGKDFIEGKIEGELKKLLPDLPIPGGNGKPGGGFLPFKLPFKRP